MTITKDNAAEIAKVIRTYKLIKQDMANDPSSYLPFIDAMAAGSQLTLNGDECPKFDFSFPVKNYAIKKKSRPLTNKDLKVGDIFKQNSNECVVLNIKNNEIEYMFTEGSAKGRRHLWAFCLAPILIFRNQKTWATEIED